MKLWQRAALWSLAAAALALTFAMYVRPDAMLTLADRVWSCF